MTEKRFQWVYIKDELIQLRDDGVVKIYPNERLEELLNNLNNENEQLKKDRRHFERKKTEYMNEWNQCKIENSTLKKETEELKKESNMFFGKVFDILLKYQELFNREMADEVLEELGIELTRWFE